MTQKRRDFLKQALVLPAGLSAGYLGQDSGGRLKGMNHQPAKIKLSLNAWSYNVPLYKYINGEEGGMSLFDMLEECARLDFDAVDPTGYFFPGYPEVPDRSFVNTFKRRAFDLGLAISGTGIRNDFATADPEKRKADVALAKRWIETAADMGAPVIRVFAGNLPEGHLWEDAAVWLADCLHECAEHGAQHGVIVGVQNHGGMLKSADEVITILDQVNSEWLGTIVDTGYFLTPDPYKDIERVIPYAVNWQVKELLSDRKGPAIDMDRLVAILRASEYRGYVPIETLPMLGESNEEYDAIRRVEDLLQAFRQALEK